MYKLVQTDRELQQFNGIWTKAWIEKGFELEFSEGIVDRILVYDELCQPVGTVEIKPYLAGSPLDEVAPFQEQDILQESRECGLLAEVDKVALLKEHRGKNINRLLSTLTRYAEDHDIHYYVSLLDPILYRALRITFHLPMDRVGGKIFYKGADVIPIIIHAKQIYSHKGDYDWFYVPAASEQTMVLG
ncbi:hypothetical protein DCC85_01000 [Paenibacillus sp. CAA11]|uniref:hypothetical protein n=1 Tax=Paenibacillus sp. CAA11 TaxID=1532905 RepID=UPI000D3D2A46|nr:hypothetical protein [Paenibacillus sp. CAA11]AWB42943.1 hypothetical protein DCC85_01000 [Paenibacillus sp. CAA11]